MSSIRELLRQMDGDCEDDAPAPLPEAVIETLREHPANYTAPCPFKVGDLVTPRKGVNICDAGTPQIVVELMTDPKPVFLGGDSDDGEVLTMRVMKFTGHGNYVCYWVEHWQYEPWTAA